MNLPELDAFACALAGVNQIEASAGTGKTWNICALYARLVIENDLEVDEILVVTFTNAATAELQERIRGRLAQLERALGSADHEVQDNDPFVERLLAALTARGIARDDAHRRVRRALGRFDQAAIHTIHAFCQRALQEAPFAAGLPFAFELEADDRAVRFDLAAAFWRDRVEPEAAGHADFAAWLVERGAGPEALDEQLARYRRKPLAELRWGDLTPDAGAAAAAHACASHAADVWQAHEPDLIKLLGNTESVLSQTSHAAPRIAAAFDAWRAYCAQRAFGEAVPAAALRLAQTALNKATKKKQTPPDHEFFTALDQLAAAQAAASAALEVRWLRLVAQWLDYAPAALAERKRARRTVSYDDLLSNLSQALRAHPWLAGILRARYPAALIDEFQDTDPLQFDVFSTVFAPQGPLFLVGDPKQAIYSFRAADLQTYLTARAHASARYSLAVNQRSTPAVVNACNRVFSANARAFVLDGLDYQPVRAAERDRAPLIDVQGPRSAAGLHVWTLPEGAEPMPKRVSQQRAAHACAAEIARLLRGAREGSVRIGDTPLLPGEVAVLVQTHRQGSQIKRALAQWGIGSVELAQASVFAGLDAEQLERVLAAIDTPGDLRRLRTALAADWFGLDANALWRLAALSDAAESEENRSNTGTGGQPAESAAGWVERFARYRQLWHERGFAVMWRTLDRELGVARRLMAGADGERRATDLNHLAELVQARASSQPGIAPTLRWVAAQRREGGGEAAQLRLESDRDLVQIVTVHRSKGLEYAVVFCPYLYDGYMRGAGTSKLPEPIEYRAADGRAVLHYGAAGELAESAAREAAREQSAERARLIYVALTRAVHRCYLVAGTYAIGKSAKEAARGMLNWVVAGAGSDFDAWSDKPPEASLIHAAWRALADPAITLAPLPEPATPQPLAASHATGAWRGARETRRTRLPAWRIASFSSLASARARAESGTATIEETRPDHDAWTVPVPAIAALVAEEAAPAAGDITAFPRGAAAGECLHRLFELADFADPAGWPDAAQRALIERPVTAEPAQANHLPGLMTRLLGDLCETELSPGLRLSALDPLKRLTELEFLFPSANLDFDGLRALLEAHGYPGIAFEAGRLDGYVKGFIDLIIEHEGRFWVIDWKSNHLGATPDAYGPRALALAMDEHAYELQALLYTVALHRFLRTRLPDYDYDTHVAGYLYLFVRGVRPGWISEGVPSGVHERRAPRTLIEALDAMFRGETV